MTTIDGDTNTRMTTIDGDTNTANVLDRATTALEAYRLHGSWTVAAQEAGYTNKGSAYRAAMTLLGRRADASAAALRSDANDRTAKRMAMLDDMVTDLALSEEIRLRAHAEFTRLEARHARLNGLDAPLQVALSAGVAAELDDALAEAEAFLGETIAGVVTRVTDEPLEE